MALKEKVTEALQQHLNPDHIHLEEEDGISGYVVSAQFKKVPALERQKMIYAALHSPSPKITKGEHRQILAIAGLTPIEYAALGFKEKESRR